HCNKLPNSPTHREFVPDATTSSAHPAAAPAAAPPCCWPSTSDTARPEPTQQPPAKASGKRRVTILTPTAPDDLLAVEPAAEQSSFMTRSRTEPKLAASSAGGRPSYIGSRDWARLSGAAGGGGGKDGLPALSGEHRLAWPEHCRMDSLARRGFHRSGISISRHLDRYTLIDTVAAAASECPPASAKQF
uniref:SANT domain-containing protein n=1 Tax=Macrostomum lignano TaxID=282301 RepID=A0A1I8FL83_9PLAT